MANQSITGDTNHDGLTGRLAGEDITINNGATLTINSSPQETAMGILGDLTIASTGGTIFIDGRYVREVTYSGGTGAKPSTIPLYLKWDAAGSNGKVIRGDSGDTTSGRMTITVDIGDTLQIGDTISTLGDTWRADIDSVKVGFLRVFGEDQVWGAANATATFRIQGDWYEIGTGDSTNYQTFILPHTGTQGAIWVETGAGDSVYQIWHKVNTTTSTAYYDSVSDWNNTFESGFVFSHTPGDSALVIGDSVNGGIIPYGARVRIPNVHIGTTTTGAPFTEYVGITLATYVALLTDNVNEVVEIDHCNMSGAMLALIGDNSATVSDSVWNWWNATNAINKINGATSLNNVACIGGTGLAGDKILTSFIIIDNIGGITITDCVITGCNSGNNSGAFLLTTMSNITFEGTNKFVSLRQNENTYAALRATTCVNIDQNGTLILLNGGFASTAGGSNFDFEELVLGQVTGRGTLEDSIIGINMAATYNVIIHSGRMISGGNVFNGDLTLFTDCDNITIRNFGEVDNKIDSGARGGCYLGLAGVSTNILAQRLYLTNRLSTTSQGIEVVNSCADITIENCSCDYDDEIELDATRILAKGIHGASGNPDTATGVEGDLTNCLATIFLDYFRGDTEGAIGLVFNDKGVKHAGDVSIDSGTPVFDGLGHLLMRSLGDTITYTFPYSILGHTGFKNTATLKSGTNTGNLTYYYSLDTGSGYGAFKECTGANLSGDSISPGGFGIKIKITCNTASSSNLLDGFAIITTTTISDQKDNLYPIAVPVTVKITAKDATTSAVIEGARVYVQTDAGGPDPEDTLIFNDLTNASGYVTTTYSYTSDQPIDGKIRKGTSSPLYKTSPISATITSNGLDLTIFMIPDE